MRPKAVVGDALFGTLVDRESVAYVDEEWNLKTDAGWADVSLRPHTFLILRKV